jgi:hypothetical protein
METCVRAVSAISAFPGISQHFAALCRTLPPSVGAGRQEKIFAAMETCVYAVSVISAFPVFSSISPHSAAKRNTLHKLVADCSTLYYM